MGELAALLRENNVTELVDIRSYPSSTFCPQWNQAEIIAALPAEITYRWISKLGGKRRSDLGDASPNRGWRVAGFRSYADYMLTRQFAVGLEELTCATRSASGNTAIMCAEAVPWRCHRSLVTDALLARGVEVRHITGSGSKGTRIARMTDFAVIGEDRGLTYPPAQLEFSA